jgi:hypothetical protein
MAANDHHTIGSVCVCVLADNEDDVNTETASKVFLPAPNLCVRWRDVLCARARTRDRNSSVQNGMQGPLGL